MSKRGRQQSEDDAGRKKAKIPTQLLSRPLVASKWQEVGVSDFNFEQDARQREAVRNLVEVEFPKYHARAKVMEEKRVEKETKLYEQGLRAKHAAMRPTDVALRLMKEKNLDLYRGVKVMGHVPGILIGDTFRCRSQMMLTGLHTQPLGGIDTTKIGKGRGLKSFVTSIVVAGGYQDDEDYGDRLVYTGSGGNKGLGDKTQYKDQELTRGNLALLHNAQHCVPVRVIRTYKKMDYSVYDGLYDVDHMTKEKGVEGFIVYRYHLTRCPGQEECHGIKVEFSGGSKRTEKKKDRVVCLDISLGKEELPIPAVNNVDDMLPPGIDLEDVPLAARAIKEWKQDPAPFTYSPELVYDAEVERPEAPPPPSCAAHDEVSRLNRLSKGVLPYTNKTLGGVCPMLYECADYMGCTKGASCSQRLTQSPMAVKLRVFKTEDRGWAVQTLEKIPAYAFVSVYRGVVYKATHPDSNDNYAYSLCRRTDYDDAGNYVEGGTHVEVKYVITGKTKGNLFRYVNHSCDPNCFIQPTLQEHKEKDLPSIALFTQRTVQAYEEITYDYGRAFVDHYLGGKCKCRTAVCSSREVVVDLHSKPDTKG
ncbi:hypothetical protein BSKO_06589 [Bryopsis sp. KO-2023]|nr:hypothetical protein BSKO_06589 [Bryopsis sp. KO-2023]